MDVVWVVVAFILLIIGIVGDIVPAIPGVPLSFAGLLFAQLSDYVHFTWFALVFWGMITISVTVLEFIAPPWIASKLGGTKWGAWGCTIGLIIGLISTYVTLWGFFVFPFVGAFVGELIKTKKWKTALVAGLGSWLGMLVGTMAKLICSVIMIVHLCAQLIGHAIFA